MGRETILSRGAPTAWLQASRTVGDVAPLGVRWDSDGRGYVQAYCNVATTAKNDYKLFMGQYGWTASTVADATGTQTLEYIGFPVATYSTANYGWFQISGVASDVVFVTGTGTVGHAVKLASDTAITSGAAPSGLDNEFAIILATTTDAATYTILLFPVMVDGAN